MPSRRYVRGIREQMATSTLATAVYVCAYANGDAKREYQAYS